MSSEVITPGKAAAAQEFPDRVGFQPDNPYLTTFRPYIPAEVTLPELTVMPLVVGTILGIIFGASSLYLVLKVGLTVSASIPVAVISITLFRLLSKIGLRDANILEHNIVQTAGSAGESIAFGLGVTMPAIMILGFDLEITRVMLVAILGGLLGILMMIPLRRALIVAQHGYLKYPEGTACAEVLKAGANEESRAAAHQGEKVAEVEQIGAKTIFAGFGIGFIYATLMKAFSGWKEAPEKIFGPPFVGGSASVEVNPALLGVGYIIGPRIASIMCAGGVLAYLVLIPAIKFFGSSLTTVLPPGDDLISKMSPDDVRNAYVLYIGAGAVAAGGIISLGRSLPVIWHGLKEGLKDLRGSRASSATSTLRTDRDMSMKFVLAGIIALMAMIMGFPQLGLQVNILVAFLGAILIIAFGFLFVTVSSRLTGEIGSSSNPISGMTVATLLLTCLIFLLVGWTGPAYYVTALSIGAIVCIASSNGGTTSQDLKTGFLIGSTPRNQQIAILIGAFASALLLGPILLSLNSAGTVYVPVKDPAVAATVVDKSQLAGTEKLSGPQSEKDQNTYGIWQRIDPEAGTATKYLVNDQGVPVYKVDPGINGKEKVRPDGSQVDKFKAPKATLMSYIIKGILDRRLPWGLVLLGVMIAIVLEMSGIPSLAFAVGVYLPLSSSSPIFIGGMIRWLIDKYHQRKLAHKKLSEEELQAEGDKSPGVLMASGYIAGGALAGIVVALMTGWSKIKPITDRITTWSEAHNPFFPVSEDFIKANPGANLHPNQDLLSLIPFVILMVILYAAGRELILTNKNKIRT
jgi:putative OPT family oligopeptide transporter